VNFLLQGEQQSNTFMKRNRSSHPSLFFVSAPNERTQARRSIRHHQRSPDAQKGPLHVTMQGAFKYGLSD
jgi:hypothetical protein